MLSFPLILAIIFTLAGGLLGVILLVVLLPRRDDRDPPADAEEGHRLPGRNGEGYSAEPCGRRLAIRGAVR